MVTKPGKHQRNKPAKMPRFRLEGPWPCKIFCFALIHCARATQPTRFCWLDPQCGVNNYFVLCTVKAKKANKNLQQRTLSGFIAMPLYYLWSVYVEYGNYK